MAIIIYFCFLYLFLYFHFSFSHFYFYFIQFLILNIPYTFIFSSVPACIAHTCIVSARRLLIARTCSYIGYAGYLFSDFPFCLNLFTYFNLYYFSNSFLIFLCSLYLFLTNFNFYTVVFNTNVGLVVRHWPFWAFT